MSSYLILFKYAIHLMTAVVLAGVGGQHDTLSKDTLQNAPEKLLSRKLVSSAYFSLQTSFRLLFAARSGMFGFNTPVVAGPFCWDHCAARLGTTLILMVMMMMVDVHHIVELLAVVNERINGWLQQKIEGLKRKM